MQLVGLGRCSKMTITFKDDYKEEDYNKQYNRLNNRYTYIIKIHGDNKEILIGNGEDIDLDNLNYINKKEDGQNE